MRLGRQHVEAEASITVSSRTFSGSASTDSTFLNPRMGFLWTWSSGLSVGFDAGLHVPLNHTTSTTVPAGVTIPESVATTASFGSVRALPTVTLLRLGMLF